MPTTFMTGTPPEDDDSTDKESNTMSMEKSINYPIIPKQELTLQNQLGVGTFGTVYKGYWNTKYLDVALKKVFDLDKEAEILAQIRHRNIIKFYGVSLAKPDYYIVTEFAANGSLYEQIHVEKKDISFDQMLQWATQIAHGVAYLHYEAPITIIHRDLKSKNIVLGNKMVCKLCDFGTSKDLTHSFTEPSWGGTAAWMSPEMINQREGITTAVDVWSFSIVLWEMIAREIPYKGLTEFKIFSIISSHGVRLVVPESCPTELATLIKSCWRTEPKNRLDMREVITKLELMANNDDLNDECRRFMERKLEWMHEIEEQITQLNELKMDLARKAEELDRRENALKVRELSQRNLKLLKNSTNDISNAITWDEDQVLKWAKNVAIAMCLDPIITEKSIDLICKIVKEYKIDGQKLLNITAKDLEMLGFENLHLRVVFALEIEQLRHKFNEHTGIQQFPSLKMSVIFDANKKIEKNNLLLFDINIQMFLYIRKHKNNQSKFKVFVDSDWTDESAHFEIPHEIDHSSHVIKEVCITILDKFEAVLVDVVRCDHSPFGYNEWSQVPLDLSPVKVICQINFSEQVVSPQSHLIETKIVQFDKMECLVSEDVTLKLKPFATETSLSRANNSYSDMRSSLSNINLQGVWKNRRDSYCTSLHTTPLESPEISVFPHINPLSLHSHYNKKKFGINYAEIVSNHDYPISPQISNKEHTYSKYNNIKHQNNPEIHNKTPTNGPHFSLFTDSEDEFTIVGKKKINSLSKYKNVNMSPPIDKKLINNSRTDIPKKPFHSRQHIPSTLLMSDFEITVDNRLKKK
uniref:Protein kinase domain-containing protein n=1 Tax=Strongyloides stercoralis TaxID=6248 RepID=A0A0K0DZ30_STRER